MSGSVFILSIVLALVLNWLVKKLLKKWKTKNWVKNLVVFLICSSLVFPLTQINVEIVNTSLAGKSGGIEMLGIGIGAGLSVIIGSIIFIIINVVFLAVRLIIKKENKNQ